MWAISKKIMKYKYEKFEDYFDEVENYATRGERFYDEFSDPMKVDRAIQWLEAAFKCGRETQSEKEIND